MEATPIPGMLGAFDGPSANRLLDMRDSLDDRFTAEERCAVEEIVGAFKLIRQVPAARIAVPCVEVKNNGGLRERSMSLAEAIRDLVGDRRGEQELLAVLEGSDCQLVQKLRNTLCREWVKQWASDIAEARA